MGAEDLATELLSTTLDAEPLAGSMYGFPGYDDRLPDFSEAAQSDLSERLASIARRAEEESAEGLGEVESQTLDFVRHLARGMADAAPVPLIEFTICDTFVAPVSSILTTLPKLPLQTEERRSGYLTRLHALPEALATAAERHRRGVRAGHTGVARLVESAIAQLDFLSQDDAVGGIGRSDQSDDQTFAEAVAAALDTEVRPALAAYQAALRADVLPHARDDDHPGICFLPEGREWYDLLIRLHTSMPHSADELHELGQEIVGQVSEEMAEVGARLWGTTNLPEIFDHLCNDPTVRYASSD